MNRMLEALLNRLRATPGEAKTWCTGRFWLPRLGLAAYLGYVGIRHLFDPVYSSLFGPINLGIHEAGHVVFSWAGMFVYMAGGTILQLAAPVIAAALFRRARDYFGITVCGVWLATNLYNVATYVGDARAQALPLVTLGGGDAQHDWTYLLGELGLLSVDGTLAFMLRVLAFLVTWGSMAAALTLIWWMARAKSEGLGMRG
jgi:hypothetical protein